MNTKTAVTLLGVGALLLYAGKKAYSATALNFYPQDVLGVSMDGTTPVIRFRIAVQNPTSDSFFMKTFLANIYANGNQIGNGYTYLGTDIKPYQTSFIDINFRISLLGVAADLYQALVNKTGFSQQIHMSAHSLVDGILIPIKLDYKIG